MQVRPAVDSDIEQVVALALRAWAPVHRSMAVVLGDRVNSRVYPDWASGQAAAVRESFTSAAVWIGVGDDPDVCLGFVSVLFDDSTSTGEIDMVAVDPVHQRRGVGRALMECALLETRARGCTLAVVATGGDPGHAAARALYERCGFTGLPLVRYYQVL